MGERAQRRVAGNARQGGISSSCTSYGDARSIGSRIAMAALGKPQEGWVWPAGTRSGHIEPSNLRKHRAKRFETVAEEAGSLIGRENLIIGKVRAPDSQFPPLPGSGSITHFLRQRRWGSKIMPTAPHRSELRFGRHVKRCRSLPN